MKFKWCAHICVSAFLSLLGGGRVRNETKIQVIRNMCVLVAVP